MRKQNYLSGFSIIEVAIVVVVVAVIGFLGWKFYDTKVNQSQQNNAAEKAAVDMVPEALSDLTDIRTIQQSALADKPGVTVIHVELEQSGDNLVYKAELSDGTVTVYNARTGSHIRSGTASEKTTEVLPADLSTGISFARALEIARAEKPGSKVYKIELEREAGVLVYSVRFADKARVDVNAQNGSIVRTKAAKVETKERQADKATNSSETTSGKSNSGSSSSSSSGSTSGSNSGSSNSGRSDDSHSDNLSDNDDDDDDDDRGDDDDDVSGKDHDDDDHEDDNSGSGSGRH